ncbi:NTP transferase domain-containing protein [Marinibactrum halimedae]|uniref:4-diphosphocytidyl-2C-methyl-D-erythritol synthase n=1 Tax=Marinibactrum halimedae TaxID=1444977 RepID=A0AA37T3M1_9GAMM|nr:nucleotidyltransferase family protein [Marinibactrum halimedae]MCD9457740.1 nucleotidyltransferase family protein [Marinibactrum halimedae]GLS24886.1 4-diphosphocytidyl-2C-methyl-D-erythritol synthase [Marinibactrum halimedae]
MLEIHNLYGVILASGSSTRLGWPKQQLLYQGKSLIEHGIDQLQPCLSTPIRLVLPPQFCQEGAYPPDIVVVPNEQHQRGMSTSIHAGINAIPPNATGVMLCLCDQPLITSADYANLITHWSENVSAIVASYYSGTLGAPAIFPARYFSRLCSLNGDRGARALLENNPDVLSVPIPAAAVDIDTIEDVTSTPGVSVPPIH